MVIPEKQLRERFNVFDDTCYLEEELRKIAQDECFKEVPISSNERYIILEACENLMGLYDLCRSFVMLLQNRVTVTAADERTAKCWAPGTVKCDCPACGGYND